MTDLTGRTVLIAGATSASGLAAARTLTSAGARVVATGRHAEKLVPLAALGAHTETVDLADERAVLDLSRRLHDRGWSLPATGIAWAAVLLSFLLAGFAGRSVVLVVVVVVALDIALQVIGILNQLRVFAVSHEARSRLNTAYVTTNFIGGALGSAAATALWSVGGWTAVTGAGAALSAVALLVWAVGRRGALIPAPTP